MNGITPVPAQPNPARRFSDALGIQQGACNPSGIVHSLANACRECIAAGIPQQSDPAVRLMVHQLAYITGVTDGCEPMPRGQSWDACMAACRAKVADQLVPPTVASKVGPDRAAAQA